MKIGLISCEIQIVSDKVIHCSVNESLSTSERQLPVTVSASSSQTMLAGQQDSVLQTPRAGELCTGRAAASQLPRSTDSSLLGSCVGRKMGRACNACSIPGLPVL